MADPTVQQSHTEILRRIEAAEDKLEKRIRSLEARTEERFTFLEGRLDLLDRRLLSLGTRVDSRMDAQEQTVIGGEYRRSDLGVVSDAKDITNASQ
jgi:hypothetical protein